MRRVLSSTLPLNDNSSFVPRTFVYLLCTALLTITYRHGATLYFSEATKLDAGPFRGLPIWLMKSRRQQSFSVDDRNVPRPSDLSFSTNRTHSVVPISKTTEDITNIVLHRVKETVSHTGTLTSLRIIAEQFIRQLERVSERTFERIGERSTERTMKRATERTLERMTERTYERVGERVIERFGERVLERAGERVVERTGERSLERVGERVLDQVGKKALIKQSEKKVLYTTIFKVRTTLLGKSLSRSAIRIGRTLTIALPLLGGLFALYLFQADVQRVQEERRIHPLRSRKEEGQEPRSLNMIEVSTLLLFISTGLIDLLDALVHFWIAYGLFISHSGSSSHYVMEQISICCAILSTLCAVFGEVCSYMNRNNNDNRRGMAS